MPKLFSHARSIGAALAITAMIGAVILLALAWPAPSRGDLVGSSQAYREAAKESESLRDKLSSDKTLVYFSLKGVRYGVPRNYIINMDSWNGGPQSLVALRVTFPDFKPYSEATKDCLTAAPAYRPRGCVPVDFYLIGGIPVSDDEAFNNSRNTFRSQTPDVGPSGFQVYRTGPDNARNDTYRKKTRTHTLIYDCGLFYSPNDMKDAVCDNESRLLSGNAVEYHIYSHQLVDAEKIDDGVRALVSSFTLTGDKK